MFFALGLRQLDQVLRRQPRGFRQHGPAMVISSCRASRRTIGGRRLLDGGELRAHFGQRNAGADIGERADFDGFDEAFEHVAEQFDLFAGKAVGGQQEQVRDAADGFEMFFRRTGRDRGLDFVGEGLF